MTEIVRIGVIGVGGWGRHLGSQVAANPEAEITAFADVSADNRAEAETALSVPDERQFADHESMLSEVSLDGVVITTPHTLHYEHVLAALDRDVHVLCEKPLTPDVEESRDLVRRAEESDRILMVGYQRHVHPAYMRARERLTAAEERPKFITAEITQDWLAYVDGTWRVDPDLSGGGQLYDSGNHLIDAVLWMTGLTPTHVTAEMEFHDEAERIDVQAVLNVRFEEGTVASISVSGDSPHVKERIHVSGERAMIVEGENWDRRRLTVIDPDDPHRDPDVDEAFGSRKVDAFVDTILRDGDPPATARDALRAAAVTEAAYESAKTGDRIEVDRVD